MTAIGAFYRSKSGSDTVGEFGGGVAEIGFYHLTRTRLEQALPALLGRTIAAGERAVVLCGSDERVASLDAELWACKEPDWLPHGSAKEGDAERQPIWLTTVEERPNGASFLFLVDGRVADLSAFRRVFDLFDGVDPAAVAAARERWAAVKASGAHTLAYWKQGERGWMRG